MARVGMNGKGGNECGRSDMEGTAAFGKPGGVVVSWDESR